MAREQLGTAPSINNDTATKKYVDDKVADAINDGVTTIAPSQNAVFDALALKQPLDSDLTTIAGLTATTNNFMVANGSAWASRTPAQARVHLGIGSVMTSATVATSQTTVSTSFADLTTTTDTVTVTIGSNGVAQVSLTASISNSGANYSIVGFAVSGASTIAAADTDALLHPLGNELQMSWTKVLTGLTAGSTTFKMKYRVTAGTGTFKNRSISVVPG